MPLHMDVIGGVMWVFIALAVALAVGIGIVLSVLDRRREDAEYEAHEAPVARERLDRAA